MSKMFNLQNLQLQSKRQNFRRRQGLLNYEIPVFKKVNGKDLRGIINKKINKIGKFYQRFKKNRIPENLLPETRNREEDLVDKYWKWEEQKDFMKQKHIVKLLANTSGESGTVSPKIKGVQEDKKYSGLPLIKSKLMFKHKGHIAKNLKKRLEAIEQLRKEVSSDLELIQKENKVFGMNYEQTERNLPTSIQHRNKR